MSTNVNVVLSCLFAMIFIPTMVIGQQNVSIEESESLQLFNDRIVPIFRSPDPSSCVQCHLSSVDLKNYILPSHEKTFVSLRDQKLIDLEAPENSKILKLISMGHQDADKNAKMIHADMRKAEYDAFVAWLKASVNDEHLRSLPPLNPAELAHPERSDEVIRFTRKNRVINSFVRNVWSQRMRCFPCHTEHEIGPNQKNARTKFEDWYGKYGERMKIFKKTPRQTVQYLVEKSQNSDANNMPMLNLTDPANSLLVLKPTAKLPPLVDGERTPTYTAPIYHGGGLKMHHNDHSYKSFIAWIKDYSMVTAGNYKSVEDLPDDNWFPTQKILRIKDVPAQWKVGATIQMIVYAKLDSLERKGAPVAFTQGTVTPRFFANGALILLAPTDNAEFASWRKKGNRLPAGQYVVEVFVDEGGKLDRDPTLILDKSDFRGSVGLEFDNWNTGFRNAKIVSAAELAK